MNNRGPLFDLTRNENIGDLQLDQITASQFAVDGKVEQRWVTMVLGDFKTDANFPDMFRQQWAFLPDNAAFVPGRTACANGW